MLAIEHSGNLLQGEGILLNGQGTVNGANTIAAAQGWVGSKPMVKIQLSDQLRNFRHAIDHLVCDFKRRLGALHYNPSHSIEFHYIIYPSFHQS